MNEIRIPTICLVDDNDLVLKAMSRTLNMAGYTSVMTFTSWSAAVIELKTNPVDILVLDILMPEISGVDALVNARKLFSNTLVLMVTGVNDVGTAVECMKNGASDYLTKPVDSKTLITCITSLTLSKKLIGFTQNPKRSTEQIEDLTNSIKNFHPDNLLSIELPTNNNNNYKVDILNKFIPYICQKSEYSNPHITLSLVAKNLETNTSYLSKSINNYWKINFRTLLNNIRLSVFLDEAIMGGLLDYSIAGLANTVGFERTATFFSVFKSRFGITPSKLLKYENI